MPCSGKRACDILQSIHPPRMLGACSAAAVGRAWHGMGSPPSVHIAAPALLWSCLATPPDFPPPTTDLIPLVPCPLCPYCHLTSIHAQGQFVVIAGPSLVHSYSLRRAWSCNSALLLFPPSHTLCSCRRTTQPFSLLPTRRSTLQESHPLIVEVERL